MESEREDPLGFLGNSGYYLNNQGEIVEKIKLIIKIRWFVSPIVFIFLCISALFGLSAQKDLSLLPMLINTSIILLFNVIYKILVKRLPDIRPLIYLQLFIDALHFSLTIYHSGGVTSPFTFLYLGVILAAAILVSRIATTYAVIVCILLYSGLIALELTGILPHKSVFFPLKGMENIRSYVTLTWLFNIASFLTIAVFITYLFSSIRKQQLLLKEVNGTLNRKVETFLLLYNTSEAINASSSVQDLMDNILGQLLNFLNLDRALLYLLKEDYLELYRVVHNHEGENNSLPPNLRIPLTEEAGLTARTAMHNRAINVTEPENSGLLNRELARKVGMNPFAMAPLTFNKKVLGVLGIDRNRKNGAISEEEFKILKIFANQAAIGLQCFRQLWREPSPKAGEREAESLREVE